jgi:hypothetical protein
MRRIIPKPEPWTARWSLRAALAACAMAAAGVALARFQPPSAGAGLAVFAAGMACGFVSVALSCAAMVTIWRRGSPGLGQAARALVLVALLSAWPAWAMSRAILLPRVNDVTTDIEEPPSFSRSRAALDARGGLQPPEYAGPEPGVSLGPYRDLQTIVLDQTPEEAYRLALRAAGALRWRIIDQAAPGGRSGVGRIDAVAQTFLFRFSDDVTVRIRAGLNETQVDVRSRSRIGRHDLGANAARVRAFADELRTLANAR